MEDMQIVDLYFARSEQAVAETAHKYGTYLFSIAHNILMNRPDAEEAVSDTYLGAWNSIPPQKPAHRQNCQRIQRKIQDRSRR